MGVSSTQASLQAVRQDLDLPAAGSMSERAVLNKVNKQSGPVSLAEYKGNVFGTQLEVFKCWGGNQWRKLRWETSAHIFNFVTGANAYVSGNKIGLTAMGQGASGDSGSELRIINTVSESGSYRLTGKSFGRYGNYDAGQIHIQVIANATGYLEGVNNVLISRTITSAFGRGEKSHSFDLSLSTSQPYITLILRNIIKSSPDTGTYTHDFWDWKLEKI